MVVFGASLANERLAVNVVYCGCSFTLGDSMVKSKQLPRQPKPHHRVRKLMKLALLVGAAYGVKKAWSKSQSQRTPKK